MTSYMLGVDIGTTSTKAVLFTKKGDVIQQENVGYPLYTPDMTTAEQDPEEIFQAVLKAFSNITKQHPDKKISFISFSSAMHSVIAMDENDQPLTRCITWADNRSEAWAHKIKDELDGHEVYKRTGTPIHPMSPLSKITWIVNDHPEIATNVKKYIGIKEYIFKKFFDQYVVDYSLASSMGMLNLKNLDWDEEALRIAGITRGQLSELVPTTKIFNNCDPDLAKQIGIDPQTSFVIGASDGVLSNLGVNAIRKGEIAVTIGTSGAIRTIIDEPKTDEKGRIFCYALTEKHWVIGGPVNNGGMVLRWIRDEFASSEVETAKRLGIDAYEVLTKIAERVRPGADGLLFHPYLAGERAPLWNPDVRGSFFGLTLSHKKEHMIRAALEGVIYNLYTVFLALTECMDGPVTRIQATGGFARSAVWRQMMSDIFESEVVVPESYESSCLGACILGLYATGEIDSFEVVSEMIGNTHKHTPKDDSVKEYRQLLPIFINLSRVLGNEYTQIANYQRNLINATK
ncbi:gluconokinase [Peribacillus simplex]|uniref:Gluconokinase n=2 Tax=Peribacillus simplex TaxID=1478 RepID=A0A223EGE1_9BACI|nr:gluconokinase [Peribacillus simplex]ASS94329.1 gluconokinase [Peribacillus simplex NBRC 15720 = DSM 1321]MEC1400648.1 gluconokinase [Peribacillus simplex]MED3912242.1 gluconokinase [Peribacillus simplex]MED3985964.1 gluconokinase [Peribacillus simplex]MED4096231.1 gluconokinase [Peribacillus simplex]